MCSGQSSGLKQGGKPELPLPQKRQNRCPVGWSSVFFHFVTLSKVCLLEAVLHKDRCVFPIFWYIPQMVVKPELGQTKARNLGRHLDLPHGIRARALGPSSLAFLTHQARALYSFGRRKLPSFFF